jgi:hypothetical protein
MAIGVAATLVLALMVVITLLLTCGSGAVSENATAIGGLILSGAVFSNQLVNTALGDQHIREARALEDRRAHEEDRRAHEAALQNYFEQVGALLIEQPLHRASPGDNLSAVVRAQTLAVLEGLDPDRKRILLMFLHESGLIDKDKHKDKPVVSLSIANLREANLREANLREADLSGADPNGADLSGADLSGAIGITNAQLEQQAAALEGAIMPDESKHS